MLKLARNFAVVAVLSLVSAPILKAETTGCDPRPKKGSSMTTTLATLQYTVLAYFGL